MPNALDRHAWRMIVGYCRKIGRKIVFGILSRCVHTCVTLRGLGLRAQLRWNNLENVASEAILLARQ